MYMNKLFNYSVNVFELNKESREFLKWFKTSLYVEDFTVEIGNDPENEGIKVLEVVQHNPLFNADALEEVYLTETGKNRSHICKDCEDHSKIVN